MKIIFFIFDCASQLQKLVVSGDLPCSKEEAVTLASIQLHIEEAWPDEDDDDNDDSLSKLSDRHAADDEDEVGITLVGETLCRDYSVCTDFDFIQESPSWDFYLFIFCLRFCSLVFNSRRYKYRYECAHFSSRRIFAN